MKRDDEEMIGWHGQAGVRRGLPVGGVGENPPRAKRPERRPARATQTFAAAIVAVLFVAAANVHADVSIRIKIDLPEVDRIDLVEIAPQTYRYEVTFEHGLKQQMAADEFTAFVVRGHADRNWLHVIFNITTPAGLAWVFFGMLAQAIFMGRMVVQWIYSERAKRSVVPAVFWWMSLVGASMLLIYFLWRRDIVGVLGQSAGWVIYVRNLWMIRRSRKAIAPAT